jgi:hypothetical protein
MSQNQIKPYPFRVREDLAEMWLAAAEVYRGSMNDMLNECFERHAPDVIEANAADREAALRRFREMAARHAETEVSGPEDLASRSGASARAAAGAPARPLTPIAASPTDSTPRPTSSSKSRASRPQSTPTSAQASRGPRSSAA